MDQKSAIAVLARLGVPSVGAFRGRDAVAEGVTRKQLGAFAHAALVERVLPDTYVLTSVPRSQEQSLRAALLWAGDDAAAVGRSAGAMYGLEGVRAASAEIVVPRTFRPRDSKVVVHRTVDVAAAMVRTWNGVRVTGVEATLVALAAILDDEALEIACEDARRRRLTTIAALRAYLTRHAKPGVAGIRRLRALLDELDPTFAARSTLEVKTRRLLVARGLRDFVREFPLEWNGQTYRFDFAFPGPRVILETNGRRWHDDVRDYERDQQKWSVPAFHGFRVVLATWDKVTGRPDDLLAELGAAGIPMRMHRRVPRRAIDGSIR
jgi:predicted transcriptional regulator of viral defense system